MHVAKFLCHKDLSVSFSQQRVNRHWERWTGLINFWHLYNYPQHSQYIGLIINFYSQHLHSATPNIYCVSASLSTFAFDACPELPPGFFAARPPHPLLLLTPAWSYPMNSLCHGLLIDFDFRHLPQVDPIIPCALALSSTSHVELHRSLCFGTLINVWHPQWVNPIVPCASASSSTSDTCPK